MDYTHAMLCSFVGAGPALAIFFLLRAKRRAWIPPLAWWLFLTLGAVVFFYGLSHSTVPSFSRRITAVGKAYDHVDREIHTGYHHDTVTAFVLSLTGETPSTLKLKSSFHIGTLPQFSTDSLSALCISTMIKGPSKTKRLTLKSYRASMRGFVTLTMRGQLGSGWEFQSVLRWLSLDLPVLNT